MKKLPPIENNIYSAIIGELEKLESEDVLKINGHHLAQKLTTLVSESLLSKQRLIIYNCLNRHDYLSVKDISKMCNLESRNVSSQLLEIYKLTSLISFKRNGKLYSWIKN